MDYQWISEITILQASQVVFFQHLFVVTLCRCPRQPISGLVVPGAFRPLGSSRGHPGENSAVSWASNFEPHPVGLRSSFIFLLMLPIVKMIGLGEQISSRGCCEATDVVGILFLFNLALWILWLPDSPVVLLHITAAIAAFLKAASSLDWSQQLSQLSLRQVGSDFCSQFISDHLSSKICVDLSCFGGYADSTTSTG